MPASDTTYFEFTSPDDLLAGVDAAHAMGFSRLDAFTPYPVPALDEKLAIPRTRIPLAVLVAGALGCGVAYLIMWFCNAYDYALDVGGRPLDSIPADIPIMFETTVLFAGTAAFLAVLFRSGMPRLHHPIHDVPGSEAITLDRFWLAVEDDPSHDPRLRARLLEVGAVASRTRVEEMGP
jgi:hypothetical protein